MKRLLFFVVTNTTLLDTLYIVRHMVCFYFTFFILIGKKSGIVSKVVLLALPKPVL